MDPPQTKSWSIHTRAEITSKYSVLERIGSGAYSDVYKAIRRSDSLTVALKEIHDYQSAFREIEALKSLQNSPNVVVLLEYFWSEDEDAVLVLEYLPTDLSDVIKAAGKKGEWGGDGGLSVGEIKRWMVQILCGVDTCHRNNIVHRDLKPSNLLISADGVLKLADFGQARILLASGLSYGDVNTLPYEEDATNIANVGQRSEVLSGSSSGYQDDQRIQHPEASSKEEYGKQSDDLRFTDMLDETDIESNIYDGDASCLATCTTIDAEEDPLKNSYPYETEGGNDESGSLTSCVGTRWYRAPELLYGSTNYGFEIDLWSLGCIFAELLSLEPLFPGTSDIDQLSRIFNVMGNLSEEIWPGCVKLPDYNLISFGQVENPTGLEAFLPNRPSDEINLVKKLLRFDPESRATAMELLHDKFLYEEPLPVPVSELRVPPKHSALDSDSPAEYEDFNSDSDFDEFGPMSFTRTEKGFSIRFS